MGTTISLQRMPAPEVVTIDSSPGPFEIVRVEADGTQVDLFVGWDDASAAEQALLWIEAFQEARNRALRRLLLRDLATSAAEMRHERLTEGVAS